MWLNTHHLERVKVRKPALDFLNNAGSKDVSTLRVEGDQLGGGRRGLVRVAPLLDGADHRDLDLHAARHAAVGARDRQALSAATGLAPADVARRARARRVREGAAAALARSSARAPASDMWLLGITGLVPGGDTYALLFGALRRVHRADPVPRPVARRVAAVLLRARRASGLGDLGRGALPLHPPDRGARRRAERHGLGAAAAPAARDLRPARRRRDLRAAGDLRRAAAARRRARRLGVLPRPHRARDVGGRGAVPADVGSSREVEFRASVGGG